MIYYIIKQNDNTYITGGCTLEIIPEINGKSIGEEVSKELHDNLLVAYNNGKIIYKDEDNNIKIRDRLTKYDESTKQWMPDIEAIANEKKQLLKFHAQEELNNTSNYSDPAYRLRLSDDKKNHENDLYRAQLYDILEDKYNGTELPINPNK